MEVSDTEDFEEGDRSESVSVAASTVVVDVEGDSQVRTRPVGIRCACVSMGARSCLAFSVVAGVEGDPKARAHVRRVSVAVLLCSSCFSDEHV